MITGDETFTRFRRKLEDQVTWAINNGRVIGKRKSYCPLGASWPECPQSGGHSVTNPASWFGIEGGDAWAFADGYDDVCCRNHQSPYYALGQLYRKRFP